MGSYGGGGTTRLLILFYWIVFFFFAEKVTHPFGRSQTVLEGNKRAWEGDVGWELEENILTDRVEWRKMPSSRCVCVCVCVCVFIYIAVLCQCSVTCQARFTRDTWLFPDVGGTCESRYVCERWKNLYSGAKIRDGMIQMYWVLSWTNFKKIKKWKPSGGEMFFLGSFRASLGTDSWAGEVFSSDSRLPQSSSQGSLLASWSHRWSFSSLLCDPVTF